MDEPDEFDTQYNLKIFPHYSHVNAPDFVTEAQEIKIEELGEVSFFRMKFWIISESLKRNFIRNVLPDTIPYVNFDENLNAGTKFEILNQWVYHLLPKVTEEISIRNYYLKQENFENIINYSNNCKRLNILVCWVHRFK